MAKSPRGHILSVVLVCCVTSAMGLDARPRPVNGQNVAQKSTGGPPASAETVERLITEAVKLQQSAQAAALRRSIAAAQEAARISKAAGNTSQEATALHTLGRSRYLLGDLHGAVRDYEAALSIRRGLGEKPGEVATRAYMASAYYALGEPARALEEYQLAARLAVSLGDQGLAAYATNGVGNVYGMRGDPHAARNAYTQALDLWRAAQNPEGEGIALNNLGVLHDALGERQLALRMYQEALPRVRLAHQPRREAGLLHNIGMVYSAVGRYRQGIPFYEKALTLERATGDRRSEAQTHLYLAAAQLHSGAWTAASREYARALSLARQIGDRDSEGDALHGRGEFYAANGQHEEAVRAFRSAHDLHRAVGNARSQGGDLMALGISLDALDRIDEALGIYADALQIQLAAEDRVGEAATRYQIARAHARRQDMTEASAAIESAIALTESLRTNVTAAGLRMAYFATVQNYYRWYIDLLMQRHREDPSAGFDLKALEVAERSRARGLLDLLNEAEADIMADVAPELAERHRRLRQMLSFNATRRLELPANALDRRAPVDREIASLLADYDVAEAEIKASSPRYAALAESRPLHYDEIQALLDGDTTLLIYVMGEERAYAWVLTESTMSVTELNDLHTLTGLARSAQRALGASPFDTLTNGYANTSRAAGAQSPSSVMALTEALLEPVAGTLKTRRLAIVAEGVLEYLPIGALPSPRSLPQLKQTGKRGLVGTESEALPVLRGAGPPYRPLLADREVIYLPSPSALGRSRADVARRASIKPSIAILADPVFADDDPRVRKRKIASSDPLTPRPVETNPARSLAVETQHDRESFATGTVFPRLPSTRREAAAIAAIAGDSTLLALDFEASRAKAMDPSLRDFSIIHFATHAVIDDRYPELAGIVLSRVTPDGLAQDGFLRLQDIYALRLSADMVVLSACRTALGQEIRGEGLVGLVRGFMSAGAPRVLASLWTVDDAATAELMTAFYTALLRDRLPASIALQRAQQHMWQQPKWRNPFYWAAFVLQGDWK